MSFPAESSPKPQNPKTPKPREVVLLEGEVFWEDSKF